MKYVLIILATLVGAFDIWNAIRAFNNGHYFLFAIDIMLAIWMAALLVKEVIGGIGGFYTGVKEHEQDGVKMIDKMTLRAVSLTLLPADPELKAVFVEQEKKDGNKKQ